MEDDTRISRREALKKAALVGAVAWTAPAVQTFNMRSAFAQGTSAETICSRFRIENGHCGPVGANNSCLPSLSDQNCCDPINTALAPSISTPTSGEWVVCLDSGCVPQVVSIKSGTACLNSPLVLGPGAPHGAAVPAQHDPPQDGDVRWSGWFVDANGCLHAPQLEEFQVNPQGSGWKAKDTGFLDVIVCCPRTSQTACTSTTA